MLLNTHGLHVSLKPHLDGLQSFQQLAPAAAVTDTLCSCCYLVLQGLQPSIMRSPVNPTQLFNGPALQHQGRTMCRHVYANTWSYMALHVHPMPASSELGYIGIEILVQRCQCISNETLATVMHGDGISWTTCNWILWTSLPIPVPGLAARGVPRLQ